MDVTFVELSAFESILPLASGYMQAYACQDPEIRATCSFDIFSASADSDRDWIADELIRRGSSVYGIGCYVWNMGLVSWLLERLREACQSSYIILGGPQVMNHATDYLARDAENVVVCNGEGERTFHEFLREVRSPSPDFTAVQGLSFMRRGRLVTTEAAPRIQNLTDIPSPFAAGVFAQGKYTTAILETNRGCPFRCGFCYWGAATNDRVHRFEDERIKADITWIAENGLVSIMICDANWGMLPRDIELTEHIVECSQRHGYPLMVSIASAKNSPDRVATITEILVRGGLLTSQPISLQTLSTQTLELVDRANIKHSAYVSLQESLREKKISSYIELIWPLPGETPRSFREGIATLCRAHADTIIVYPQLLLHNTPIHRNRDRLGVRVARVQDPVAEADVVVQTKWVTKAEYADGVWFYYAVHSLYNLRGLVCLATYLDRTGRSSFEETFESAAAFFKSRTDDPVCAFFAESVSELGNYAFHNFGLVAHLTLHANRAEFDRLLHSLVRHHEWWDDPAARAAFEVDLVMRPYVYAERFRMPEFEFEHLHIVPAGAWGVEVELSDAAVEALGGGPRRLLIEHTPTRKLPFMAQRSLNHNASYCQGMILRMQELLPLVKDPSPDDRAPIVASAAAVATRA